MLSISAFSMKFPSEACDCFYRCMLFICVWIVNKKTVANDKSVVKIVTQCCNVHRFQRNFSYNVDILFSVVEAV